MIAQPNADTTAGTDVIQFRIASSGVQRIVLAAASGSLPAITRPVLVDGSTEPGFSGTPLIVLDGTALNAGDGLDINAAGCTVQDLAIGGFTSGDGIVLGQFGSIGVTGNTITHCYIGVDADGASPLHNDNGILIDNGASNNFVGPGNVISSNISFGVEIGSNADNNHVVGNLIGLDATGLVAVPNLRMGIIVGAANGNVIGGTTPADRNVISSNIDNAVTLDGAAGPTQNNVIEGNFIGTDITGKAIPTGSNDKPDAGAIVITDGAQNNTVGGTVAGAGNVVAGNGSPGVVLANANTSNNLVAGNFIGTVDGVTALANQDPGVEIGAGASSNTIGGTTALAMNVISGNAAEGVLIEDAATTGNLVEGNHIGTDLAGTKAVPNGADGVFINSAPGNTIGGPAASQRNIISGNGRQGITIFQATASGNIVQGNYLGTDVTGSAFIPNAGDGIRIDGAANNQITGNVISGNSGGTQSGVTIVNSGASGNVLQGNFIGTDHTGMTALPNGSAGVSISGERRTTPSAASLRRNRM